MEKAYPFVSVIIPVQNDAVRLKKCLQALEEQTYPKKRFEVVVVDNASDETVEPIVGAFSQARLAYEARLGAWAARNKALSLVHGPVLAFTDSDCIPCSDWIEKGTACLMQVPNCGIVGGKVQMFFQDPERPNLYEIYDSLWHLNQKLYVEKLNYSVTANLFTYQQIFDQVGAFDGTMETSEDKDWGMRVASLGYSLYYADDVCVSHPARASLAQLRKKVKRASRGTATVCKKHHVALVMNRDFLLGLIPPVLTVYRLRKRYHLSPRKIGAFLLIWGFLKGIIVRERLSVMFDGSVERETDENDRI